MSAAVKEVKEEARLKREKEKAEKARRAILNVVGIAMIFVIVAFLAFALGITFGLLHHITNSTNSTLQIPKEFQSAITSAETYSGLGLQILLVVGIISAILLLLSIFGVRLGGHE